MFVHWKSTRIGSRKDMLLILLKTREALHVTPNASALVFTLSFICRDTALEIQNIIVSSVAT